MRRAVFEEDVEANAKALTIVQGFAATDPHAELNALLVQTRTAAERRYTDLMARPEGETLINPALRREFIHRLFNGQN